MQNTPLDEDTQNIAKKDQISDRALLSNNKENIAQKNKELNQSHSLSNAQAPALRDNTVLQVDNKLSGNTDTFKLAPSMNFMKNMQTFAEPYYDANELPPKIQHKTQQRVEKQNNDEVVEVEAVEEESLNDQEQIVEDKPKKIFIQRRNTQNDINEIIKRFKKNNNPALSLFIAKKYYEMGDYHQSYNYALITNQINKEIEASWLIFSRSLVKLGKRDMALKTLQEYIQSSHSSNARILLNDIRSGKFK
ncbi:hypothetical protein [Sulfurimonas sp.]